MATDELVKVKVASVAPGEGGAEGTRLLLTTVDGLEVKFDLDDLALALLSFTSSFVVKDLKAKQDAGHPPLIHTSPAPPTDD